jgi:hypothetical protein
MTESKKSERSSTEKLLTFRDAATQLGVPYFKIQRAARSELFPTYRFFNSRPLVRLSEVLAAVEASRVGEVP